MYLAYSLLALLVLVVVSPYFAYQAIRHRKYIGSLGQRLGYLPVSFNVDGEESIWQPEWSPTGDLVFASDRSGWWNLERVRNGERRVLHQAEAEFGYPAWAFGMRSFAFVDGGRIACGHVGGVSGAYGACEIVRQLKEQAGDRQIRVRNGRGVMQCIDGHAASNSVTVFERDR